MVPLARVPLAESVSRAFAPPPPAAGPGSPTVDDRSREWRVSLVSPQGSRVLVRREPGLRGSGAPEPHCRECATRALDSDWTPPALRPDTAPGEALAGRPPASSRPGRGPVRALARRPVVGADPAYDRLRRDFWSALLTVLLAAAFAWATTAVGHGGRSSALAVRALGWPALALPLGVLWRALRRGVPGGRRPDLVLAFLGVALEASAVVRLHALLGVLLGVG